jgi:hypothetical protein
MSYDELLKGMIDQRHRELRTIAARERLLRTRRARRHEQRRRAAA